jgi:GT2 family glycosyltransferase
MAEDVDVVLVVVTWNSSAVIAGLLESLSAAMLDLSWRVVVADNASSDDTVALAQGLIPDATVIDLGRNAGYSAAINAGLRVSKPNKAFVVVNPDVRFDEGCVKTLVEALADPTVGIAVPNLRDAAGRLAFTLHRDPTVGRAFGDALLGGGRAGRYDALGEAVMRPERYRDGRDVDWASGAIMALSPACVEAVGEWDESFWLYSEETDYCLRARDAGYRVRYVPQARAVHLGSDMHVDAHLWTTLTLNRVRLYRRRHGRFSSTCFHAAVITNEALRSLSGRGPHRKALVALARPLSSVTPGPIGSTSSSVR